ncbi:hypothetical protein [Mucilaginibacter sp.]
MQGMVQLRDALNIMDARHPGGEPIPFSLTFITCNLTEKTGGERRSYEGVILAGGQFGKKNSPKNANHYDNGTRNVNIPGKSRPVTIHIYLITHLNNERVII